MRLFVTEVYQAKGYTISKCCFELTTAIRQKKLILPMVLEKDLGGLPTKQATNKAL